MSYFNVFPSEYYYFYSRCDSNGYNYHNLTRQYGEKYGENSLCILSSLLPSGYGYTSEKIAGCHKITCNYDKLTFNIDIGDVEVECSGNYEEITVKGYSGSLICPDYNRVCTGSVWCNDPLTCIEKYETESNDKNKTPNVKSHSTLNTRFFGKLLFIISCFLIL